MTKTNSKKSELDSLVVSIEFLLISVVQGFALSALAAGAVSLIGRNQWEYAPYLLSAFLIILVFWSQSIIHTISFISWPIDLTRGFLYFAAGFVEVIAFAQMTDPFRWFLSILVLYLVGALLYVVDLRIIADKKQEFMGTHERRNLFEHIVARQMFEIRYSMPAGLVLHALAVFLLWRYPEMIRSGTHLILAYIQLVIAIVSLLESLVSFRQRIARISRTTKLA